MPKNRVQFRQLVDELASEAKVYMNGLGAPHPFIARLLSTIGWNAVDFLSLVLQKQDQFVTSCTSDSPHVRTGESRIEKFCHKIWLTSSIEPHLPPEDLLASYFSMCKSHPTDWTHLFWTNNAYVLRHVSARAADNGARILVLNIDGMHLGSIEATLRRLIADCKFVLAADVLKFVILDRYGGIYSDLGVFFDEDILQIAAAADYTFLLASNVFFQTSWVSLAKGSILSSVFLGVMNSPEILSSEYALDESQIINAGTEVHTFAGLGYTTCALLFMPRSATCFAFPENLRQLKWRGQQSWYGDAPKFGNALINKSVPSVFEQEKYERYALRASERLRTVNADGQLTEMAKVMVNLFEYFQINPNGLSKCFWYNGSDREGGWHNYGFIYFFLFEMFAYRGCAMLEVGDVTSLWGASHTNEGAVSSGGSVRAWREYAGAITFSAEIDRSATGPFDVDRTFIREGDQRVPLRRQIELRKYALIIDNGFHHFDAATTLLEAAIGQLAAPGIYVIEAVPVFEFARWEAYLGAAKKTALMVSIPSLTNSGDNSLIIVIKGTDD